MADAGIFQSPAFGIYQPRPAHNAVGLPVGTCGAWGQRSALFALCSNPRSPAGNLLVDLGMGRGRNFVGLPGQRRQRRVGIRMDSR